MVWKDFELMPTRRVTFYRRYLYWTGAYGNHLWSARGGWSTTAFSLIGVCAGYTGYTQLHGDLPALLPLRKYAFQTRAILLLFILLGYKSFQKLGTFLFGNHEELWMLKKNKKLFKKELNFYGKASLA